MYYGYWLVQVVFSYFVLHRRKMPLVLSTQVTHLRSRLFRQPDGVSVVRRVYLAITAQLVPKLNSSVSGLWVLTMLCLRSS